jgi:hypothetical protein
MSDKWNLLLRSSVQVLQSTSRQSDAHTGQTDASARSRQTRRDMFSANDTMDLLSTMGLEKGRNRVELTVIFSVVGAGLVYARAVHAAVPPGPLRMLLFAPCIVVNAVLPATLMDPFKTFILTGLISANFAWWTNFKLLAFALDRGQGLTLGPISAQLELTLPLSVQLKLTMSPIKPKLTRAVFRRCSS